MSESSKSLKIATLNGGSSSIRFAVFAGSLPPRRLLRGLAERVGQPGALLTVSEEGRPPVRTALDAGDHAQAAERVADLLAREMGPAAAVGHRVVHGGPHLVEPQLVTPRLMDQLRAAEPLDRAHLPREIALIDVLARRLPRWSQVVCFDAAFHRDLPRVAQLLPIPREYTEAGVRRLGFHGLSYTYLMGELGRVAGQEAAAGRVVLAHLGSGASMAAVRDGRPVDTTMAFTPTAGLVMGTRPGDLDPGLLLYLMRAGGLGPDQADDLINHRCGLLGVSQTSADMRDLLQHRDGDPRAAEAVALFCYQAQKWIGALCAALGGLDTLVFSGGIGENAPQVRAEICSGLQFLGIELDARRNAAGADVISADGARVTARVIRTDEEIVIAETVLRVLQRGPQEEPHA